MDTTRELASTMLNATKVIISYAVHIFMHSYTKACERDSCFFVGDTFGNRTPDFVFGLEGSGHCSLRQQYCRTCLSEMHNARLGTL